MYYVTYELSEVRSAARHDCLLVVFSCDYGSLFSFLPLSQASRGYPLVSAALLADACPPSLYADTDSVGILVTDDVSELEFYWADDSVDLLLYRSLLFAYPEDARSLALRQLVRTGEYFSLSRALRELC